MVLSNGVSFPISSWLCQQRVQQFRGSARRRPSREGFSPSHSISVRKRTRGHQKTFCLERAMADTSVAYPLGTSVRLGARFCCAIRISHRANCHIQCNWHQEECMMKRKSETLLNSVRRKADRWRTVPGPQRDPNFVELLKAAFGGQVKPGSWKTCGLVFSTTPQRCSGSLRRKEKGHIAL